MSSRRARFVPYVLVTGLLVGCVDGEEVATADFESEGAGGMPAIIPVSSFFDNPEIAGAQISPDGEWLSYLKAWEGKLQVFAKRVGTDDEIQLTADTERPVTGYFWSIDASKVLYVQDRGGNENFHIHAVPVDGTPLPEATDLTPYEGARAQIFAVPPETPDRIFIGMNQRDPQLMDGYWLDLDSGDLTMVAENPGRHLGYMLDHEQQARIALGQNMQGGTDIFARDTEASEWRLLASYPATENVNPIQFHKDNQRIYLSSDHGETDLQQLVLMDISTGETEVVERDPEGEVDFGGAVFSSITHDLIATTYNADKRRIYFKDAEWEADYNRLL
ncbi:MAG: hypothetical protein R3344_13260, partial [Acidobacteriota bacterium]|nr:hypothetical protein [Acidobacteriota bacterium]